MLERMVFGQLPCCTSATRAASDRGLRLLNAAVYGVGMLSDGPAVQQKYGRDAGDDRVGQGAETMSPDEPWAEPEEATGRGLWRD